MRAGSYTQAPDRSPACAQVHVEVIGAEDGPEGGNTRSEGGTGSAGVRDRLSQARLTERVRCIWRGVLVAAGSPRRGLGCDARACL
jgi:hypothetical protein